MMKQDCATALRCSFDGKDYEAAISCFNDKETVVVHTIKYEQTSIVETLKLTGDSIYVKDSELWSLSKKHSEATEENARIILATAILGKILQYEMDYSVRVPEWTRQQRSWTEQLQDAMQPGTWTPNGFTVHDGTHTIAPSVAPGVTITEIVPDGGSYTINCSDGTSHKLDLNGTGN